jgi:16S rRNA G1207 methylase RsmC
MAQEHYFSADPASPAKLNSVTFEAEGQSFTLQAASGTFSSGKLDPGTKVLLGLSTHFPTTGKVLDLGCGWGPIGISIAKLRPHTEVLGLDVNERSIELANQNAARLRLTNFQAVNSSKLDETEVFDAIWSNPPIRIGKQRLHDLLSENIAKLKPTGSAYLVVQKQLGADSLQQWLADTYPEREVVRVENSKGYRVIKIS